MKISLVYAPYFEKKLESLTLHIDEENHSPNITLSYGSTVIVASKNSPLIYRLPNIKDMNDYDKGHINVTISNLETLSALEEILNYDKVRNLLTIENLHEKVLR